MSFFSLRDDELFALFRNAPIETINCLCRSHPRISRLSREPRFRQLMEEKMVDWLVEHYSNQPEEGGLISLGLFERGLKEYALIKSIRAGNLLHVNLLLKYGADPTTDMNSAIILASQGGHLEIVNRLLEDPRVDPSDTSNWSIILASASGHLEIVNRLLDWRPRSAVDWRPHEAGDDRRVDPSDQNNLAIIWASRRGRFAVVDRLLRDPRVDPRAQNNLATKLAQLNNHREIVELLSQHI